LVKGFGRHPVHARQVSIEHDFLAANHMDQLPDVFDKIRLECRSSSLSSLINNGECDSSQQIRYPRSCKRLFSVMMM